MVEAEVVLEQQLQVLVVEEEREQDCQGLEEVVGDSLGQGYEEESLAAEPGPLRGPPPGGRSLTWLTSHLQEGEGVGADCPALHC